MCNWLQDFINNCSEAHFKNLQLKYICQKINLTCFFVLCFLLVFFNSSFLCSFLMISHISTSSFSFILRIWEFFITSYPFVWGSNWLLKILIKVDKGSHRFYNCYNTLMYKSTNKFPHLKVQGNWCLIILRLELNAQFVQYWKFRFDLGRSNSKKHKKHLGISKKNLEGKTMFY